MRFVNRQRELAELRGWWSKPGARLGLVWGRRRIGKTLLLQEFAKDLSRVLFHTFAGRSAADELNVFAENFREGRPEALKDFEPPTDSWRSLLRALARESRDGSVLLILDEFQEGVKAIPELPGEIRALWDDHRARAQLRVLLCGSAMRTMEAMQTERAPLYGRMDLSLLVHPFSPHEAALMLPHLHPYYRMVVWGLLGGVPLYLDAWDQDIEPAENIDSNLYSLFFSPNSKLLLEGELALQGEALADIEIQALHAVALGRTRHSEIQNALRREPSRQLERLIELRLIERVQPITEEGSRSRRRTYRVADNFFAFLLGHVLPHRTAIDRGLGHAAADIVRHSLGGFLGLRWEEAFREHLRRLAAEGLLGPEVAAIGPFWMHDRPGPDGIPMDTEIDAVALAGGSHEAVLVGEAKLHQTVDARPVLALLQQKAHRLPKRARDLRLAIAGPLFVQNAPPGVLVVTATDVFGIPNERKHPTPIYVVA